MESELLTLLKQIDKKLDHLISQRDFNTLDITSESAIIEGGGGDVMEALFEKSRAHRKRNTKRKGGNNGKAN